MKYYENLMRRFGENVFDPFLAFFGYFRGYHTGQNSLFLPISGILGFQIFQFLVRSFEMLIIVYEKMFAHILRKFGLSSGHFRGLLPPENSQKS